MRRLLVLVAAGALVLAACGDDDSSDATLPDLDPPATTAATTAPSTAAPDTTAVPESTSAPDTTVTGNVFVIRSNVVGGQPEGGLRSYLVEIGQTVEITITSDRVDEAHLHGYDLDAAVTPGTPTTITFTADTEGSFEMELHESGELLFYLDVI
jgi:hypothetical protein